MNQCTKYIIIFCVSFHMNYAMEIGKQTMQASVPVEMIDGLPLATIIDIVELEVESIAIDLPENSQTPAYHSYLRDCCRSITNQYHECVQGCCNECRYVQESCHGCNEILCYPLSACMCNICCCTDADNIHHHICEPHQFIHCQEDCYNDCCYVTCCFNPCDRVDSCFFRQSCRGRFDKHPDVYCCVKDEGN